MIMVIIMVMVMVIIMDMVIIMVMVINIFKACFNGNNYDYGY